MEVIFKAENGSTFIATNEAQYSAAINAGLTEVKEEVAVKEEPKLKTKK